MFNLVEKEVIHVSLQFVGKIYELFIIFKPKYCMDLHDMITCLGHIIHGKVRVTIRRLRVMWVTIWFLNMNFLPQIGKSQKNALLGSQPDYNVKLPFLPQATA